MMRKSFHYKLLLLVLCCNAFSISVFAQWSTTNLLSARSPAAASAGTFAVFAGGADGTFNPTNAVDIYDNSTGFWSPDVLSGPKSSFAGAATGTKVFFAGGFGSSGISDVVDIYDVVSQGWTLANLSEARFDLASASLGTRVFFGGGFSGAASSTVDIYNSSTGFWTVEFLSVARTSLAAAGAGTKVLFAGGFDFDPDTFEPVYSNVVDIFDTGSGMWTTATLSQERAYLVAAAVGTKVLFAGGSLMPSGASNVVDIYDVGTGLWTTATLSQPRTGMAATTVGSKVFFAGGSNLSGNSNVVDIYDNSTGLWTTSTLSVARTSLAGTSVGSTALFAGGSTSTATSIVDIYDASCNSTILTITPPVSICLGESANLTVSGGSTYQWSPADGLSQTTGSSVTATPTTTTTYLVRDTGLGACSSVTVTVGTPFTFTFVSPTQTICTGKSTRLQVSGAPNITWSPSTGLSATSGSIVFASPAVTTTYTVTGSDGGGCVLTTDITVVVDNCTGLTTSELVQNRWDLAGTSVGTKVLFAGGTIFGTSMDFEPTNYSTAVDIYDNATGTWSSATLSRGRTELAAATAGTKALFAGGRHEGGTFNVTSSDVVDIYDNGTGTWSTANLSEKRHLLAAASVGTKAFFGGGFSYENGYSSTVDIYDNSTGMWTTESLSVPRAALTATSVGTKVFFAGGIGAGGIYSDVVDIYDISTGMWLTPATLSQARQYLASTTLGTKVFFGGGRLSGDVPSTLVDIYDNSTDTWSTGVLSEARDFLAATSSGTMAFFAGGDIGADVTNTIDIYDESTDTWTTGVLSVDRSSMAASSVGNKVIFAGGLGLDIFADGLVVDMYDVGCINNQVGVSASLNLCLGSSTILTATDASSYSWSPATGLSATTGSSVTANPTSTQTYIVTGDHGGGCFTTASVTVTVIPVPTVTATPSHSICIGTPTNLVATGANTYTWSPSTDLSATTGSTVTATPTSTITYTVVGTALNGCTDPADVTVTVNSLPVININPPAASACPGAPTNLVASGAVSYSWSPPTGLSATTGASVTASPLVLTTYTVNGTDANGCVGIGGITITMDTAPTVTVSPSTSICAGAGTTLEGFGASTYSWSPATGLSATTGNIVTASPAVTTTYTVSGFDGGGCPGIANVTVTVFQDLVDVTPSMSICTGDTRTLTATGATSYTWSPAIGLSATTGSSVQANPTTTTTYTVTGSYGTGCTGEANMTVTVNSAPIVSVAPSAVSICSGTTIDLTAGGAVTYTWSPLTGLSTGSGATVTVNTLVTTTYTVTGIGANGCTGTANSVVTIIPLPAKPVITTTPAGSGHFVLTSSATTGNQWFKNGVVVLGATNQTFDVTLANEGTYTVITTQGSCTSLASDPVPVFVTGFEESISNQPLLIHPNPAVDFLHVQWNDFDPDNAIDASVVDQTGRSVVRQELPPQGGRLDISGLSPGLYLLQATQGSKSRVQKFVKR